MKENARKSLRRTDHGRLLLGCIEVLEGGQPSTDEWERHHRAPDRPDRNFYAKSGNKDGLAKAIQTFIESRDLSGVWIYRRAASWWLARCEAESRGDIYWHTNEPLSGEYFAWIFLAKAIAREGLRRQGDYQHGAQPEAVNALSRSIEADLAILALTARRSVTTYSERDKDGKMRPRWQGIGTRAAGIRTTWRSYDDRPENRILERALGFPGRFNKKGWWADQVLELLGESEDWFQDQRLKLNLRRMLQGQDFNHLPIQKAISHRRFIAGYEIRRYRNGDVATWFTEPPPTPNTVALWGSVSEERLDPVADLLLPYEAEHTGRVIGERSREAKHCPDRQVSKSILDGKMKITASCGDWEDSIDLPDDEIVIAVNFFRNRDAEFTYAHREPAKPPSIKPTRRGGILGLILRLLRLA